MQGGCHLLGYGVHESESSREVWEPNRENVMYGVPNDHMCRNQISIHLRHSNLWTRNLLTNFCLSFHLLETSVGVDMAVMQLGRPKKLCFVTIGATASFDPLIKATLSPKFLEALRASGYTDLLLQHGSNGSLILEEYRNATEKADGKAHELNINGFDFNKQGLGDEMRAVKGEKGASEGVVISHAGRTRAFRIPAQTGDE